MAFTDFNTIVELSQLVTTQWQIKYDELIKKDAAQSNFLTTEIVTKQTGVHIPFINTWKGLDKLPLYANLTYETSVAQYVDKVIARYAKGLQIGRFDWADPSAQSILMTQLNGLVAEAAWRRTQAIFDALVNGDTSSVTVYDEVSASKNLFANDHTLNGYTFDNLLGSMSLTGANFQTVKNTFSKIPLGPGGKYLPVSGAKYYLVVPPALEISAKNILNSSTIYESNIVADNPYKMAAEVIVSNLLTDETDWYMIMTMPGITPFATVRHVDSNAALLPFIADTDKNVVEQNMYLWALQIIEETYPIHYYQMIKVVNS